MVAGNPKGNSYLILPFTETIGWSTVLPNNQRCRFHCFKILEAVIVVGLGE